MLLSIQLYMWLDITKINIINSDYPIFDQKIAL